MDFSNDLNIVTGETGSGKSLILDALLLAFGDKIDTKIINGTTTLTLILDVHEDFLLTLRQQDVLLTDTNNTITLKRIIQKTKNYFSINNTNVPGSLIRLIKERYVHIHHQFDQSMFKDTLKNVIDRSIDTSSIAQAFKDLDQKKHDLQNLINEKNTLIAQAYVFEQAFKDLSPLGLKEYEEDELIEQKKALGDSAAICQHLKNLLTSHPYLKPLYELEKGLEKMSLPQASTMKSIVLDLESILEDLGGFVQKHDHAALRIEEIDARLYDLQMLKKRYHVHDLYGLWIDACHYQERLRELDDLIERLQKECSIAYALYKKYADDISAKRKSIAERLKIHLINELNFLKIPDAHIDFRFKICQDSIDGYDFIETWVSFNPSIPPGPIAKCASGGEWSRFLLALKTFEGTTKGIMIFDEIDSGTSGIVAKKIGEKIKEISGHTQTICITHSPHVAAVSNRHFKVDKKDQMTTVTQLSEDQIIKELAILLGGDEDQHNSTQLAVHLRKDIVKKFDY
jgi:DNA repair protein RecN (Recombination protein N)